MTAFLKFLGFDFAPIQTIEAMRISLSWGWAGLVLISLFLLPLFVYIYKAEGKPLSPVLKGVLLGLRLAFVLAILSLLAGLKLSITGWIPQKNKIAVLFDSSRSMGIKEEGATRIDRVRDALVNADFLRRLEKHTGIAPALFSFSGSAAPLSREDISSFSIIPDGNQTNLTKVISEIGLNLGEGNLLGIILFTDGAYNQGDNPLQALSSFKTPLYFLGAGKTGKTKDLAIALERPPTLGFLNSRIRILGELKAFQVATDSIQIEVKKDGKRVENVKVAFPPDQKRASFAINVPCDTEGTFAYGLSIPRIEGELTYENNDVGFLMKVVKERLKILALVNSPNWEQSFIKAAVKSDPNAHYNSWTKITDDRWIKSEDSVLQKPVSNPDFKSDIEDTDVLILAGVPEKFLSSNAEAILKRIEIGKLGVFILPASQGYSELGYIGSTLARLFPVDLFGEAWSGISCNLVLPVRDNPYGFLRLLDDPIENQDFFRTLPKFEGLFTYPKVKAGAEVLLSTSLEKPGGQAPGFLHQRIGQGNVVMLLGGPLWPIGFKLVPTDKTIKPFTAFILNTMKWLANRKEDAQVTLELPSSRGFVGQPLTLRVWVTDNKRQAVDSAQVTANITSKEGEPVSLSFIGTSERGCYESTFIPPRRGLFDVNIAVSFQGQAMGEAKGQILVEFPTVEFDDPEVRTDLMSKLASFSHGAYLPVEKTGDLLSSINPTPGQKQESKTLEVRDSGIVLLFLLLIPLLEWVIRRIKGFS